MVSVYAELVLWPPPNLTIAIASTKMSGVSAVVCFDGFHSLCRCVTSKNIVTDGTQTTWSKSITLRKLKYSSFQRT